MLTVTKIFRDISYGHHLPEYDGKCKTPHGHNATLEVEVDGVWENGEKEGMVCDFSILKRIINKYVIDILDHQNINDLNLCDYGGEVFQTMRRMIKMPTAENMVKWIIEVLRKHFGDHLIRVRLYETSDSYAEWYRENIINEEVKRNEEDYYCSAVGHDEIDCGDENECGDCEHYIEVSKQKKTPGGEHLKHPVINNIFIQAKNDPNIDSICTAADNDEVDCDGIFCKDCKWNKEFSYIDFKIKPKDTRVQLKNLRDGAIFENENSCRLVKTRIIKDNSIQCISLHEGSICHYPIDYKPLVREIIIDG
jgi:6-pyruvoyltetrahydropterin/6-carboxytetrahydropterin synthase